MSQDRTNFEKQLGEKLNPTRGDPASRPALNGMTVFIELVRDLAGEPKRCATSPAGRS